MELKYRRKCKRKECDIEFHWCTSGGDDDSLYPMREGYCSCEYLKKDRGKPYENM